MSVNVGELFYELGIEDNTKKDLDSAKRNTEKWEKDNGQVVVEVDARWEKAKKALDAAKTAVAKADGTKVVYNMTADGVEVTNELAMAERELEKTQAKYDRTKLRLKVDDSGASTALDDLGKKVKGLQDTADGNPITPTVDTDKIDDGAARGRGSLLDMLGGWKTAAVAAAALGGAAIADKLIEGFNGVLEKNRENDRLAASLGLSDDEATVAGRLAGDLWVDAFGDSTGQVNDAVRAALLSIQPEMVQAEDGSMVPSTFYDGGNQGLGQSADAVRQISEDALNLATIFGVDVTDSITTAAQLVRNGLAPDMTAAFDLMVASMQRVPASMTGDLMDAVNEYGPLLAGLGLTGDEVFGMLVSASGDGTIAVDKVGDALKELTIRSTDMSTASQDAYRTAGLDAETMAAKILAGGSTAREGFGEIIDGLLSIDDPVAQANAAIGLFGTPLEDLGTAKIPDFLRSMKDGATGLGDFEGAAKDAGTTLNDNLATDIEEVVRKLSPSSLAQAFDQGGIEGVATRVQEGVDKLKSIWEEYGPAVKTMVGEGLDALGELWDEKGPEVIAALSNWWSEEGSPAAEAALSAAMGVAWEGVQAYFKEKVTDPEWWAGLVQDGLVTPFQTAMIDGALPMVVAATAWVGDIPEKVKELAAGVWDPIADGFEGVINGIISAWNSLSFTVPRIEIGGRGIGGQTISTPDIGRIDIPGGSGGRAPTIVGGRHPIPEFADGGFVDAPLGTGVLALVHGGEYVNTADEVRQGRTGGPGNRPGSRSRSGSTINVYTMAKTGRGTADAIDRRLMGWAG